MGHNRAGDRVRKTGQRRKREQIRIARKIEAEANKQAPGMTATGGSVIVATTLKIKGAVS